MAVDTGYRDYMVKISVGFSVIAILLGFLAEVLYREFFKSIAILMVSEEYSYLLLSLFTVFAVLYMSIRYTGFSYGIRPSRILLSIILASLSIATYAFSFFDLEYRVQFLGISFSFLFISVILFVYDLNSVAEVLPLLTPLLIIPLPTSFIDKVTPILSKVIGRLAGFLTGVEVFENPGFTEVVVTTSSSVARFSIESFCTGITALGSVIVIIPIVLYMITFSREKFLKRIAVAAIAILTSFFIGFLGNFIKILLVVLASKSISVEHVYILLQYTPSAIYSVIATAFAFIIINKFCRFEPLQQRVSRRISRYRSTWNFIAGILLLAMIFVFTIATVISTAIPFENISVNRKIAVEYVENFVRNPGKYLSTDRVRFADIGYEEWLTKVLGALAVYRISTEIENKIVQGYIEVVDTPVKLHTWQLCLTLQRYTVVSSWSTTVDNVKITYIVFEKNNSKNVLVYTVVPVEIEVGSRSTYLYTRISLISYGDPSQEIQTLSKALLDIASIQSSSRGLELAIRSSLVYSVVIAIAIFVAYTSAIVLHKYISRYLKILRSLFKYVYRGG
jgi:hypothetical protein